MKTKLKKNGYYIKKKSIQKNILDNIRKDMVVDGASYYEKKLNIDKKFSIYNENEKYIIVPKFYGIKKFGQPIKSKEKKGKTINIDFKGSLKEQQKPVVDITLKHMEEKNGGVLCLGCGFGKTVLALYIATVLKVKTLVIVHKTFLLNQWIERIKQFTNASIGIIQQKKIDTNKDIVIGMLQSISKQKYNKKIFKDFGFVIFDEAHHAPSQYFSKALPIISCKKTLALTATPKRQDGLEKILYWYFGDIIYRGEKKKNTNVNVSMINYDLDNKKYKEYRLTTTGEINRSKTITKLTEIEERNDFITSTIVKINKDKNRKLLILSDRINHLEILANSLKILNLNYGFYIGGMKQDKLDDSATKEIILATYSMASEALDIPSLNALFMITPRSSVEQSVGRILRKTDYSIEPIIVDMVDSLPSFKRQSLIRKRLYRKMKFNIKEISYNNNKIFVENKIEPQFID
jgi:superfamily II DNA or RNA helicase